MTKWDKRFLKLAKEIATWSKDPSTQVGAIAVRDKRIIATGYNGFPKGIEDNARTLEDRPAKLRLMVHGEMNMIFNAVEHGVSLKDSTVYVWGLPVCEDCFKGLIQVGVSRVVMPSIEEHGKRWKLGCEFGKCKMEHVGIQVDQYNMYHVWSWDTPGKYMAEDHYNLKQSFDKEHGDEIEECENGY
tara:strand:- start:1044 stop:1601 length:558 start_codon:yes stop_codon:yes gene_type:complete